MEQFSYYLPSRNRLAHDGINGGGRLGNTVRNARNDEEYDDGDESGHHRGECVLGTTVLGDLDELSYQPAGEIHPGKGSSERESRDDAIEGLRLKLLGDEADGLGKIGHCNILYCGKIILVTVPPFQLFF